MVDKTKEEGSSAAGATEVAFVRILLNGEDENDEPEGQKEKSGEKAPLLPKSPPPPPPAPLVMPPAVQAVMEKNMKKLEAENQTLQVQNSNLTTSLQDFLKKQAARDEILMKVMKENQDLAQTNKQLLADNKQLFATNQELLAANKELKDTTKDLADMVKGLKQQLDKTPTLMGKLTEGVANLCNSPNTLIHGAIATAINVAAAANAAPPQAVVIPVDTSTSDKSTSSSVKPDPPEPKKRVCPTNTGLPCLFFFF